MALKRKIYVPRNLTLPEIEKFCRSVAYAIALNNLQDYKSFVDTAADLTLDGTHDIVNAITNAITITLPPAATYYSSANGTGKSYHVANDDTNANDITLAADGAELINDSNTLTMPPGSAIHVVTNGEKWRIY